MEQTENPVTAGNDSQVTHLLSRFEQLTEELQASVEEGKLEKATALLERRGMIVKELRERWTAEDMTAQVTSVPGCATNREVIIKIQTTSRRLAETIKTRSSEVVERLVEIQKMKSSQAYTMQGAGYGYRQNHK